MGSGRGSGDELGPELDLLANRVSASPMLPQLVEHEIEARAGPPCQERAGGAPVP